MEYNKNLEIVFKNLFSKGAFLTVDSGEKVNTMTISWGSIGYMWRRPVFMVLVRSSRYTYEIIENSDSFTVSIPFDNEEMSKALKICGTKSGRDIDKTNEANITFIPSKEVDSPVVDNCNIYYECKIVYKQKMDPSLILDDNIKSLYDNDFHTLYYGEIVACYEK
ncbi:MAG: flavin reductase family protein [Vulcanibacillus sp.]